MKWKRLIDVNGIILLMIILYINASEIQNPCPSAVNITGNRHDREKNILVLFEKSTTIRKCKYILIVPFTLANGALNITTWINRSQKNLTISDSDIPIDEIQFSVSEVGSPVKILKKYKLGEWIILWPWNTVVVTLLLRPVYSTATNYNSSFEILLKSRKNLFPGHVSNRFSCYRKLKLPYLGTHIPELCLKNKCYVVRYTRQSSRGVRTYEKVRFQIINKSVCIKTDPGFQFSRECSWKIHFLVDSKIVMVLRCIQQTDYWCLPTSWFDESDILEIDFVETDKSILYLDDYNIRLVSDYSSIADPSAQCRPTLTTDYPRTRAPVEWSTWSYPADNYEHDKTVSALEVIFPLMGVIALIFVCVCLAYARHLNKRRVQLYRQSSAAPQQYTDRDTESNGCRIPNPTYRASDPVQHTNSSSRIPVDRPVVTEVRAADTSHNDSPPDYRHLMAVSSQPGSPPNYSGLNERNTVPSAPPSQSEHTAALIPPPPSYEDALDMISAEKLQNK